MRKKKTQAPTIRSSAAEYLTFIAASGEGGIEAIYADEDVWLSQKMMGVLYDVNVRTINEHLKKVFADNELQEDSVIRKFRITATDGKNYNTQHYNLSAIVAVGYKVNSERAVQFRKWATGIIKEYTIKAYVMDDERLKSDGSILGKKYFEEQLERIREIRLSERKFYQKITDIYATAIDYDVTATATKRFFATVQNKLHWAIHGQTAAEVVYWFNDRIEITSPGGPYGNVTSQNFGKPGITDYRNPNIADVLKTFGFIQAFGRGIAIAIREMERNGNPPPEFETGASAVLCILRRKR